MRRAGFTLIEAIVVLLIFVILAAILFPILFRKPHTDNSAICWGNMRRINSAVQLYLKDHDGTYPLKGAGGESSWSASIQPYLLSVKNGDSLQCPTAGPSLPATTDYFINANIVGMKKKFPSPDKTILFGDGTNNSPPNYSLSELPEAWRETERSPAQRHLDKANYTFADGHNARLTPSEITEGPGNGSKAFLKLQ